MEICMVLKACQGAGLSQAVEVRADVLEKQFRGHGWFDECSCVEDHAICIQMSLSWLNVPSKNC